MICDVECLPIICSSGVVARSIKYAGRKEVGVVCLPEANVHVEGGCKRRDFHVVCPLAGLAHLLDVLFELLLQLLLCEIRGVDACGHGRRGLAFGISPHVVHGHVLAVEIRVISHVFDGGRA
jgi:hypothetical protein